MGKEFNYLRVYESSLISPKLIVQRLWLLKPITVFLGYPNTNPERKLNEIRTAALDDPYCWSHGMEDLKLLEVVREYILLSQAIQKDCLQYGFPFFEISADWDNQIQFALTSILDFLINHVETPKI